MTAVAWGVGGYFEKKGLHLGPLSPQFGITLRTVAQAPPRALAYLIVGGGLVAGSWC